MRWIKSRHDADRWFGCYLMVSTIAACFAFSLAPVESSDLDTRMKQLRDEFSQLRKEGSSVGADRQADLAREFLAVADSAGPGLARDGAIFQASALLLEAALANAEADPVVTRLVPAPAWAEYDSCARRYVATLPKGLDDVLAIRVLCYLPASILQKHEMLGAAYSREYAQPGLAMFRQATSSPARASGGALAALQSLQVDWALACSLSCAVHDIEMGLDDPREEGLVYYAMALLGQGFADELQRWCDYCEMALSIWAEQGNRLRDLPPLDDPDALWGTLRPYLPDAILRCRGEWQDPGVMDLESNRLKSEPGLRIKAVRWEGNATGGPVPQLSCTIVLWEAHEYTSLVRTPWYERKQDRLEGGAKQSR
jgi:hypothetical protein